MILLGKSWPYVYNASGARGFFGEGYWFHSLFKPFGLDYRGSALVTKTTTLLPRAGNMPLDRAHRPKALFPDCIVVKPFQGVVLNAVGLAGPGADVLIGKWSEAPPHREPWMVSFMSVAATPDERIREATEFFGKLRAFSQTQPRLAVQINLSCPNTNVHREDEYALIQEALLTLNAAERLRNLSKIPILVKLSPVTSPAAGVILAGHEACDAVVMGNTMPWGKCPGDIDWVSLFGSSVSPLKKFGGGGLSGAPLLPLTRAWLLKARALGISKPIVAGGGVLSTRGAQSLIEAGASAIELGSVSILRPWRVQKIIAHVESAYRSKENPS